MGDKYKTPRPHPNSIVRYRARANLSLKQLAHKMKMDAGTVGALETGKLKLHLGHISLLCKIFHCEPHDILEPCVSRRNSAVQLRKSRRNLELARGAKRWAGKLKIPEHAHPLVRQLFELMNDQKIMIADLAPSGISRNTISEWRYRRAPSVVSLEAVLNSFGYQLKIVKKDCDEP